MSASRSLAAPLLKVDAVTKRYIGVTALTDASLAVGAGEVRALLGRNGAGKSTLIRILSGVEQADTGTVSIDGTILDGGGVRRANELGVQTVHQELSLVPDMTVAENMFVGAWPRSGGKIDYDAMRAEASTVIDRLGLDIDPDSPRCGVVAGDPPTRRDLPRGPPATARVDPRRTHQRAGRDGGVHRARHRDPHRPDRCRRDLRQSSPR